jgi:hypothetical protein
MSLSSGAKAPPREAVPPPTAGTRPPGCASLAPSLLGKTRIFFVPSNADASRPLDLEEEAGEIQKVCPEEVHYKPIFAPKIEELQDANRTLRPHVVHLSGHGTDSAELLFRDRNGRIERLELDGLAMLMRRFGEASGRLAVLLYCRSLAAAQAIVDDPHGRIACAIGMSGDIWDRVCPEFSRGFYGALGRGMSVASAFDAGLTEIAMRAGKQAFLPRLCVRKGVDAGELVLVPSAEREILVPGTLAAVDAFIASTPRPFLVLYHAPWSDHSTAQIDALRVALCDLGGRVKAGRFDVTDETVDALWSRKIRVFPTIVVHPREGEPRTFAGVQASDSLADVIREML